MHIVTDRLIITRLTPDMAQSIHENSLDEDTRRFIPDEVFETPEIALETIRFLMACYEISKGPLVYAVLLKNGINIGYVQAVPMDDGIWEIGYHIGKKYTGNGYAAEAVKAFLPQIMNQLSLTEMFGICLKENAASTKVLQRCGFEKIFEGTDSYQGTKRDIFRFVYRR